MGTFSCARSRHVRAFFPLAAVAAAPRGVVLPRRVQARRAGDVRDVRVVRDALRAQLRDVRAAPGGGLLGHEERQRAPAGGPEVLERDRRRGRVDMAVRVAERGGYETGGREREYAVLVLAVPLADSLGRARGDRAGQ